MAGTGFEPSQKDPEKSPDLAQGGALSGALGADLQCIAEELRSRLSAAECHRLAALIVPVSNQAPE